MLSPGSATRRAMEFILTKDGVDCLAIKEQELLDCTCRTECSCKFNPSEVSQASWIPDFGKSFQLPSQTPFYALGIPFNASFGLNSSPKFDGNLLIARGLLLDSVGHARAASLPRDVLAGTVHANLSWMPVMPLFSFLATHTRSVNHQEAPHDGQDICSSCSPKYSNLVFVKIY